MASLADQFAQDAGAAGAGGASLSAQFAADLAAAEASRAPAASAPKPAQRSTLEEIGHQLGLTARAGVTGLAAIPNMFGDALNTAINLGTEGINKVAGTNIPKLAMPSQVTQIAMDNAGVARPENAAERVVQSVASSMAGVNPSVQMGKLLAKSPNAVAQAVGNGIQSSQGLQIVGAGGAGLGSSVAAENGAGPVGQMLAGLLGAAGGAAGSTAVTKLAGARAPLPTAPRVEPTLEVADAAKPRLKLNTDGTVQDLTNITTKPQAPVAVTAEPVEQFQSPSSVPLPVTQPTGQAATPKIGKSEQASRIATLKELGLDEQRPSAYTGDRFGGAQEYQTSLLDSPTGKILRAQFEKEQTALRNYAGNIVESTGGLSGGDQVTRGTAITAPLKGLADHYDQQISSLYKAADQAAGGAAGITLDGFGGLLKTNSVFAGKAENAALRRGLNSYLKEQGILVNGELQPINAQQAEGVRQYLNSQWSPQNKGLIGKITESLDMDVTKTAGDDVYKTARQLYKERKNTLDNPKGIAGLLNEEGPGGINRQIPVEQVASRTVNMPVAQFGHVIDTLKKMPTPELQEQANQAVNEIRRQMAEQVYQAGVGSGKGNWNASEVTKMLNSMRPKLSLVFSPDELNRLRVLNDGGHILYTNQSYPGAAAQGYNMLQSGAIKLATPVGTVVGTATGSPAAGYLAGKTASGMAKGWADKNNAAKLAEMLRNPAPK